MAGAPSLFRKRVKGRLLGRHPMTVEHRVRRLDGAPRPDGPHPANLLYAGSSLRCTEIVRVRPFRLIPRVTD